jgi:hypothetical protein
LVSYFDDASYRFSYAYVSPANLRVVTAERYLIYLIRRSTGVVVLR